jgi:hypothetical protein
LTSLDHTIREGNSVISDPAFHPKAFDRQAAFPELASTAEVEPAAKRRKRRKHGKAAAEVKTALTQRRRDSQRGKAATEGRKV